MTPVFEFWESLRLRSAQDEPRVRCATSSDGFLPSIYWTNIETSENSIALRVYTQAQAVLVNAITDVLRDTIKSANVETDRG